MSEHPPLLAVVVPVPWRALSRGSRIAAWLALLLLLEVGLGAGEPSSAWPAGLPDRAAVHRPTGAISQAAQDQLQPAVAFNSQDHEYLVVWEHVAAAGDHDIYAQRVNDGGTTLGSPFPVVASTALESSPSVAYGAAANEYLVVWETDGGASGRDLRGRRISAAGSAVGGAFDITTEADDDTAPHVAYSPVADELLVVWAHASGASATSSDIHGQVVAPSGALVGGPVVIASESADESHPRVAGGSAAGNYLVVWQAGAAGEENILARLLDGAGSLQGSTISVCCWEREQVKPDVAFSPEHDLYLVVWEDHHWGFGTGWDVYGQRLGADGAWLGSRTAISCMVPDSRTNPAVAYSSSARSFLVSWEQAVGGFNHNLYRRQVGIEGTLLPETVISDLLTYEGRPAVAAGADFAFLLVWEDDRSASTTGVDIYGEVVHQYLLSGRTFEGTPPDQSVPLPGVVVNLRGSTSGGNPGALIGSTLSGADGWYGLLAAPNLEYFQIEQVTVPGYVASGATSAGGTVLDPSTIQVTWPLLGKVLTENHFWQTGPADPPPGGWRSFTPAPDDWVTGVPKVDCTVQVRDLGSGLDVSTAQYSFSKNGGGSWSPWLQAACTGSDGSLGPEQLLAVDVPFEGDSLSSYRNRIHFRINDMGGNTGISPDHFVPIDTRPPENSSQITVDRAVATWSSASTALVLWLPAEDATSGAAGYSFGWSTSATTTPDDTMDDVDTGFRGTIPGDGASWYFHVRTVDRAGHWASGAAHAGPYYLDTTSPTDPGTVTSTTHSVATWSKENQVTVEWTGGSDAGSGVAGYSVSWDHNLFTTPDTTVETSSTGLTRTLADGVWFLHVRTVDGVGSGSPAVHLGPFYIDTAAPTSQVSALAALQTSASFTVSWSGQSGSGSPIDSYDIRVIDETTGGITVWQSATTSTSGTYTGVRGHTHSFASRARDSAGNLEAYPTSPDTETTVGKKVVVRVRNEAGAACEDARVYHNGSHVGDTDSSGTLTTTSHALSGDTLAALWPVYEHPAAKGAHNLGSPTNQNWDWRAYLSSVAVDSSGDTSLFTISSLGSAYQDLTVRKSQALIGFHLLVSVEWDANSSFLDDLEEGLESASAYLYDAGDSQLFLEMVEVDDCGGWWAQADIRIEASNQTWPSAYVGAINTGADKHIYVGRYFDGSSSSSGDWSESDGFRTFIHEFGHYGLSLYDEYLDRTGKKTSSAFCATNFDSTDESVRASIMNYAYTATEFCSRVNTAHAHRSDTQQDAKNNGESCWETIERVYSDSSSRWTILTPDARGQIMAGPDQLPIASWAYVGVTNSSQSACAPYDISVVWVGTSTPASGVDVWVQRASPHDDLYQGKTDSNGSITILGARNGDTEYLDNDGSSASYTVSCSPGPLRAARTVELAPDPFRVSITVTPIDGTTIGVRAEATAALSAAPEVVVFQDGAVAPVAVAVTWDGSGYVGHATLDPALGLYGYLRAEATDLDGHTVKAWRKFAVEPLIAAQDNPKIMSSDGRLELTLPVGSLSGDAYVAIQDTTEGAREQGSLVVVGKAYRVVLSSGQEILATPAALTLRYDAAEASAVDESTLHLYRWNESAGLWVSEGGQADPEFHTVSTETSHLSVFALLGSRACLAGGDANGDCNVNVADIFYLINFLFAGGTAPVGNGDANGSGTVDVADIFYLINFLFAGGPQPV